MDSDLNLEELEGVRSGMTHAAKKHFYGNNKTIYAQEGATSLDELSEFLNGEDPYEVLEAARSNPELYSPEFVAWLEVQIALLEPTKTRR